MQGVAYYRQGAHTVGILGSGERERAKNTGQEQSSGNFKYFPHLRFKYHYYYELYYYHLHCSYTRGGFKNHGA